MQILLQRERVREDLIRRTVGYSRAGSLCEEMWSLDEKGLYLKMLVWQLKRIIKMWTETSGKCL